MEELIINDRVKYRAKLRVLDDDLGVGSLNEFDICCHDLWTNNTYINLYLPIKYSHYIIDEKSFIKTFIKSVTLVLDKVEYTQFIKERTILHELSDNGEYIHFMIALNHLPFDTNKINRIRLKIHFMTNHLEENFECKLQLQTNYFAPNTVISKNLITINTGKYAIGNTTLHCKPNCPEKIHYIKIECGNCELEKISLALDGKVFIEQTSSLYHDNYIRELQENMYILPFVSENNKMTYIDFSKYKDVYLRCIFKNISNSPWVEFYLNISE